MHKRPVIQLKPHEGRRVRSGAPWAFSNEVRMDAAAKALAPGTLVHVLGDDGRDIGTGTFNSKSLIAVRLLAEKSDTPIDKVFFAKYLIRALTLREALYATPYYRLINAEGDGLPGLVIDRFADTLVLQITTAGMENLLTPLRMALDEVIVPRTIVLRNDTPARVLEGLESYVRADRGDVGRLIVEENSVRYLVDLTAGQKTGWYYDQRESRAFIAGLAKDKTVLDAYCYAGGFGLAAAKAGARDVICLDSSAPALALAEQSAAINGIGNACKFFKNDVFVELERLVTGGEKFDIVIADPPPFVKAKKDLEPGARAYRKLARLAAHVTGPGGFLLLASCSHNIGMERFASECAAGIIRAGRIPALIRQTGAASDHPVHPLLPESSYLKTLVYALN